MSDGTEGEQGGRESFSRPAPSPDRVIEEGPGAHGALGDALQKIGKDPEQVTRAMREAMIDAEPGPAALAIGDDELAALVEATNAAHDHWCTTCGAPHGLGEPVRHPVVTLSGAGTPDDPWRMDPYRAGRKRPRVTLTGTGVPGDLWVMDGVEQLPGETYAQLVCRTQYPDDDRHDVRLLVLVAMTSALGAGLLLFGQGWTWETRSGISLAVALVAVHVCNLRLKRIRRRRQ